MSGAEMEGIAAEVLAEALQQARRDAVEQLRTRLAAQLVASAEALLGPSPAASGPVEEPAPPAPVRPDRPADGSGWYVYGVTRAAAAAGMGPVTGVAGAPVEVLAAGTLAVVASRLDEAECSWGIDGSGEADMASLCPRIREHEEVLETLIDRGPVLPFRFGRLYRGADQIQDLILRRVGDMEAVLDRLDGRIEWGLTIEWDPTARPSGARDAADGAAYLVGRREDLVATSDAARTARAEARRIHETLAAIAVADVVQPGRRAGGGSRPVALRASYLIDRHRVDGFRRAASDGLSAAPEALGLTAELTGPWPPYNFSELDLESSLV